MSDEYNSLIEKEEFEERLFINKYQLDVLLKDIPKLICMKDLDNKYVIGTKYSRDFFLNGLDFFNKIQLDIEQIKNGSQEENQFVAENNQPLHIEKKIYDKAGISHWYSIKKAPVNGYDNEVIGIVVIAENIDAEKNLQAQRETFVASLGHDLKNPTIAQIRAVELLLKGEFGKICEEQKEILEMVLDSCKYMKAMLSSLLVTYRNERGVVKLNYEEINLPELVDECVSEMIYLANDKKVGISIFQNCKIETLYGDKVQIKRVIMNLLSNGIKYAYKNSEIRIKLFNEENYTCLDLENRSPYISPEKREAIFAQYVSFAEAHKELGIGLGLYASKKIINAHGGKIFVESFTDERNIFGFKVPNVPDVAIASPAVTF